MKKFLSTIIAVLLLTGCSSQKEKIESALNEVYGSSVSPKKEDTSMIYVLDYNSKRDNQEKESIRLKDKIDKITNSIAELVDSDLSSQSDANTSASSQDDCLSDFYKWETPSIRVAMVSRKCIPDKGNEITIVVTEK